MAINLVKGDNFSLSNSLSHVSVGLGWDPSRNPGNPYDLDASAFMLGHNGRLIADEYFVFYYCCPLNFKTPQFPYPQCPSIGVADFFLEK